MGPVWERSSDVPYPKVWLEFEAKDSKDSDKLVKYRIQDLPENRFDDAVQHIIEHFLIDAPVSKFFGMSLLLLQILLFLFLSNVEILPIQFISKVRQPMKLMLKIT